MIFVCKTTQKKRNQKQIPLDSSSESPSKALTKWKLATYQIIFLCDNNEKYFFFRREEAKFVCRKKTQTRNSPRKKKVLLSCTSITADWFFKCFNFTIFFLLLLLPLSFHSSSRDNEIFLFKSLISYHDFNDALGHSQKLISFDAYVSMKKKIRQKNWN